MQLAFKLLGELGRISWLPIAGLVFARLLPIIAFSPIFGGSTTPRRYRTGLAILLALTLTPVLLPTEIQDATGATYIALLAKEALVGLTIAVFIRVVFEMVAACGAIMDAVRGATMANVYDPLTQQQTSVLSVFFMQLAVVLFFVSGGHRIFMGALGQSFVVVPPGEALPARLTGETATATMVTLLGELFVVALQLAAPVLVVMLLLDLVLGLLNRVAPQIQVFFLGITVKATLGILILFLTFGFTFDQILADFLDQLAAWLSG